MAGIDGNPNPFSRVAFSGHLKLATDSCRRQANSAGLTVLSVLVERWNEVWDGDFPVSGAV